MSADPSLDYFSDGISEDIITELSRFPELHVIARHSSVSYKGKSLSVQQMAQELGVRFMLEGSVRREGEKVRITAQLIDAVEGHHLWANRFDKTGDDVFALQDEVTRAIVGSIAGSEGAIRKAGHRHAWGKEAASLDEYDYFLRIHGLIMIFSKESLSQAVNVAEEGLERFPDSSLLRFKLGWALYWLAWSGWSDDPKGALECAFDLATAGLSAPDLPLLAEKEGRMLMALLYLRARKDHDRALAEAEATLALFPQDSDALVVNSEVLLFMSKPDTALDWIAVALQRQPRVPEWYHIYVGWPYYLKAEYERAIETLKKQSWDDMGKLRLLAASYAELGFKDEAMDAVTGMLELGPQLTLGTFHHDLPYQHQADLERELESLRKAGLPE